MSLFVIDGCCGKKGASRAMKNRGWEVITLDIDPVFEPDIVADIRTFKWTGKRPDLASEILKAAIERVGYDYLIRRPPCFLEEPYQIEWLLSYCDTSKHKGTIYKAAGFELYRTNKRGIQTWRIPLPALTTYQDTQVQNAALINPRSERYRAMRAQLELGI